MPVRKRLGLAAVGGMMAAAAAVGGLAPAASARGPNWAIGVSIGFGGGSHCGPVVSVGGFYGSGRWRSGWAVGGYYSTGGCYPVYVAPRCYRPYPVCRPVYPACATVSYAAPVVVQRACVAPAVQVVKTERVVTQTQVKVAGAAPAPAAWTPFAVASTPSPSADVLVPAPRTAGAGAPATALASASAARAHLARALAATERRDYPGAVSAMRQAVESSPGAFAGSPPLAAADPALSQRLGAALAVYGNPPRKAVGEADARFMVAALSGAAGRRGDALAAATSAIASGDRSPGALALQRSLREAGAPASSPAPAPSPRTLASR
jgi:hypothetical protein